MNKKIKVTLPVNISSEDRHLFTPFISYKYPHLSVKFLKNVFVTSTGLACSRIGLIKDCTHRLDLHDNYDRMMNEMSRHYYAVKDNENKLTILDDDETYLLIHHPWQNNYYHWVCEGLLRLWMVRSESSGYILLLPELYKELEFFLSSLKPFKFKSIHFIPKDESVLVRNLCMPKMKPQMDVYNPQLLKEMRDFYVDYSRSTLKTTVAVGERVYLSRAKSLRRKIENEDEVADLLLKYGFTIVYNEDYTFMEQVALYSQVSCLVTMHGAGLTNMLFMPRGASVLELHKKQTNPQDHHSLIYWYMADGLQLNYFHQICQPSQPDEDFYYVNFIVDIAVLEENVKRLIR